MDLTLEQFNSKYPTIKDLTKIWKIVKWNPLDPASPNPALLKGSAQAQNDNAASASSRSSASSSASSVVSENGGYPTPAPSPAPSMASSSSSTAASGISTTTSYSKKDLRWSQLDTILIDDSPSKAVLKPYNHLHIMSWKPPTRSAFTSPSAYGAPITSSSSKTQDRSDNCLLQAVAMLERLRRHTNVSAAIRSGQFQGLILDERGDAWAKEGVEVLNKKGIKHPKDFDSTWAKRVLAVSDT